MGNAEGVTGSNKKFEVIVGITEEAQLCVYKKGLIVNLCPMSIMV
jgi:hypothetical protein